MDDLPDFELRRAAGNEPRLDNDEPPPPSPPSRSIGLAAAVAAFVAAFVAAGYFGCRSRPEPVQTAAPAATAVGTTPLAPLGGKGDTVTLPPLDASDSLVRTLVQALTESPAVMAWLPTAGLIRNFTVVVSNIAEGPTPAKHLKMLRPSSPFRIVEREGVVYVDPRSYDRYATIAEAVASVDAAGAAKLYATLRPRIEEARKDLGSADPTFDRTLERAIVVLLATPAPDPRAKLRPKGIGYAYADDALESLTPAQKQLLRMGPKNVRVIKTKLRDIALALGIPAARLPKEP